MPKGTSRHNEVMSYLREFSIKFMRMPSRKEIMHNINISRGPLQRILNSLEDKGKLKRIPANAIQFEIIQNVGNGNGHTDNYYQYD